jgi:uncharacterized membrane protein
VEPAGQVAGLHGRGEPVLRRQHPAPVEITQITGRPTGTPLRLHVGMQQGDSRQARTDSAPARPISGPAWQPVIGDGRIARVYLNDVELAQASRLDGPTITFSAHPSDPVVYRSPTYCSAGPT